MMAPATLQVLADWVVTFAIHSTCVLGLALLVARSLRWRHVAWQEKLLAFSLWAAIPSATLQLALGAPPVALTLRALPPAGEGVPSGAALAGSDLLDPTPLAAAAAPAWSFVEVLAWAALSGAALGLGWLLWLLVRSLRVLRARVPETDGRVLAAAAAVAGAFGLRHSPHVSRSAAIVTPIAFGCLRPEVCLPARARSLDDQALRAMLAHEVAHLRRRDPAAMWLAAALQALFWWQPLLHCVRRRWAHLVELRCDAEAAARSSATAVARCLLDVAAWHEPARRLPLAAALGMAARPSALRLRVEAALQGAAAGSPSRGRSLGLRAASLVALTMTAPGVDSTALSPSAESVLAPLPVVEVAAAVSPRATLQMLEAEREALLAELAGLRAEAARSTLRDELDPLLEALSQSLARVQQKCQRLGALIDRRSTESTPPKPR